MNKISKVLGLVFFVLLTGCHATNFHRATLQLDKEKSTVLKNDTHENVFLLLEDELENTNHIIYLYLPNYIAVSKVTVCLLYDVDNNNYYRVFISPEEEITTEKIENVSSKYEFFVLGEYLDKKYDYLQNLNKKYYTSLGSTENRIYEIDLKRKKYSFFRFFNFPFANGKPYDGKEVIDDWL
ncbi:hypothetical protein GCM10007424_15870 [Flavobacterium suaedae]|uniref:Lipoprotein n=1 Tax=Flavobacterium suaedae TaxID=1767027 RepID=A0ABQ1JX29_9FLAO|nr:hypothetical protein [Flavobacterium suaedae]GGB76679.1 hypothetical protein GCM10007424_15870 [Flavobacterium suaedae]